jgi:membrane-associated phospholipid phosphatase
LESPIASVSRWALATIALSVVSVALGLLAANFDTFPLDRSVTAWFYDIGGWYEPLAQLTNRYDVVLAAAAGVAGVGLLLTRSELTAATLFPLAAGGRLLLGAGKAAVERPRPAVFDTRADFGDSSFPSGHVMTAVAMFGLWFLLAPRLVPARFVTPVRLVTFVVVLLHAVGRMWAGVHWFSDTYGSVVWMAAVLCGLMTARAWWGKARRASPSSEDARL